MVDAVEIKGLKIGPGQPCFVVAEAGVNHNGSLESAFQMVDVAAQIGADAIKFQTFKADRLLANDAPKAEYQRQGTPTEESAHEMLSRLELSEEAHRRIQERCEHKVIVFISTPFDEESADLLESMNVPLYKIPSGEITNLPFLAHVARKRRPMLVSTGMSYLGEVEAAVKAIEEASNSPFVLLHCVSQYPADPIDVNLRAMSTLENAFDVPTGFSDHTLGNEVALAAVTLGASVIEKHFTLDRKLPGPDQQASLEPEEMAAVIRALRNVEIALGDGRKVPVRSEGDTLRVARRSLVATTAIPCGTCLTEEMVGLRRPGTGLPPHMRPIVVGRTAVDDIPAGTMIALGMLGS